MLNINYCTFIGVLGTLSIFIMATRSGPPRNVEKFGPFCIITRSVNPCRVPGPVDTENQCTHNFGVYKISRVQEVLRGKIEVPHDLADVSAFVSAEIWRDGGYKPFFSKTYRKSCELGIMSSLLKTFFKVDKRCIIRKGNYTVDNLTPTDMMKEVIGNNFFYEKISLTLAWYTKKGLNCCLNLAFESKPLPKKTQRNRYNNKTSN